MGSSSGPVNKQRGKQACLDDDYMMYTYKVIPCSRVSTHNWKLCHFSHVGEVAARRRPPACHQADLCAYVSANKECPDGDNCPYAHNAFESWLHPDRYKTTLCSYAGACTRKFCFFAHSASELRTPSSKQQGAPNPELGLMKTSSLDTNASVGTPNSSSSSNMSSSSIAQSMQSNWTAATASPMVGASNQAAATTGRVYVNQLRQLQQGSGLGQQGLANGMYLFTPGTQQQQQQLVATVLDANCQSTLLPAGPPGLSTIMVTAPQLNVAGDAAALPLANLASAPGAAGSGSIWDSTAGMALAANIYRTGSTPISMTDGSSSFASGFMFDSPSQTPLAAATVPPTQTSMVALSAMPAAAGNSGTLQISSLQQALDASQQQQQQHNSQLRQQLLQHLLTLQQQQQQQSQQQQQQDVQLSLNNWSLPAVSDSCLLNPNLPMVLTASAVSLQPTLASAAAGSWNVMTLQQQQQQQLQPGLTGAAAEGGVQVLSAPQLLGMASTAAASAAVVAAGAGNSQGLTGLQATDASQLAQPFGMLTLAMPQPA